MSEVRYRGQLRQLLHIPAHTAHFNFMEALLESALPVSEQLRIVMEGDQDEIKRFAVYLVGNLHLHELVPTLIRLYEEAPHASKLQSAIIQIMSICRLKHDMCHKFFMARVHDMQLSVTLRMASMSAIELRNPDVMTAFLAIAHNKQESFLLRRHTIGALSHQIGNDKSRVHVFLPFLKDEEATVRWYALRCIGSLGDTSLASYVEPLLTDRTTVSVNTTLADYARQVLDKWASEEINQNKSL